MATASPAIQAMLREPAEIRYAAELAALAANDTYPKPPGWNLSPRAVRTFIVGSEGIAPTAPKAAAKGKKAAPAASASDVAITRKFHGDDAMIDRAIVTLMSNRGLLLVGEPGTAKSMLSELLAAAISGTSSLTIQGTAGTTEDQIKYSWNYALLLAEGPTPNALVPAPLFHGLSRGLIVRFEEITRCPPEIQDTLISTLSDKVLFVPELKGDGNVVCAKPGSGHHRDGEHPRSRRSRDVGRSQAAIQLRDGASDRREEIRAGVGREAGRRCCTTPRGIMTLPENVIDVLDDVP
ncbi:MAG: AAA family ATPase [Gemmataceae bacterium]